jgi:hypothetical protein
VALEAGPQRLGEVGVAGGPARQHRVQAHQRGDDEGEGDPRLLEDLRGGRDTRQGASASGYD